MARTNLGQFAPATLFLSLGLLFALISLFAGKDFTSFFKPFLVTMIVAIVAYGIILSFKQTSIMAVLALVILSTIAFLSFQSMPQYLPLQTVPMSVLPGTNINVVVNAPTVVIPDAIVVLGFALLLGLLFKMTPQNKNRGTVAVLLSTVVAFFAVSAILGDIFGVWGEWLILLTPFTGIGFFGFFIALGYIILAYLLWIESRIAMYTYFAVQVIAIVEGLWLQEWISIPFSILILIALYLKHREFKHKAEVALPSVNL